MKKRAGNKYFIRLQVVFLLTLCFLFLNEIAFAQEEKKPVVNPKLLDFETDLIEGERASPNIFVEMDLHKAGLDLVLYQRNNFNDFHLAEKNRRPRYFNIKVTPKKGK